MGHQSSLLRSPYYLGTKMIKKLFLFIFTLLINPTFCQQQEIIHRGLYPLPMKGIDAAVTAESLTEPIVIEDTGFYWVYVKHMPSLWTFWKRWKPVRIMAAYAKTSTQEIWRAIDLRFPVFMTIRLEEAQSLKKELLPLGCDIEIHEVPFSFSSKEDAEDFIK